jgi:lipoprotein-releasing system permease protein
MNRWTPFEWTVASRFLREGRVQTGLIVLGIAIGVGVIIFMSALLNALQGNFIDRVLAAQPHIQLLPPREAVRVLGSASADTVQMAILQPPPQRLKSIDQWQAITAQVRAMPQSLVVAPSATGHGLAVRGDAARAVSILGVEPALYFRIVDLRDKMVQGSARLNSGDVLVGVDLASDLGLSPGDRLRITTASGDSLLRVTGIFDLGNKLANQRNTYMALYGAQGLLGLPGGVSGIDVTVRDVWAAEALARQIAAATGVRADSWIATNAEFFSALRAQTSANTAIRVFVALSVAFGIASVLVVSVVQKSREIGILRAMGVSRAQVLRVFLLQGGVLGLLGALGGSALGMGALVLWQRYARNVDGTPLFAARLEPGLFAAAVLLATLTGLLAACMPAMRAARLDPVVAIRG